MSGIISHLSLFALKLKVFQEKAGERWEIFVSRHLSLTPAGQETSSEVLSFILLTLHWFVQECCSIILAGWTGLRFVFFIETVHVTALNINSRCYINENHTAIGGRYQPSQYSIEDYSIVLQTEINYVSWILIHWKTVQISRNDYDTELQMLQVCIPTLNTQTSCPQQIQIINVRLMILAADLPHMCPALSSTWSARRQQKEYYKRIRQRGRRGQTW